MHTITSAWREEQDKQDFHNKGSEVFVFLFFFSNEHSWLLFMKFDEAHNFILQIYVFCISDVGLSKIFSFP